MIKLNLRIDPIEAFIAGLNEASNQSFTKDTFETFNPETIEGTSPNTTVTLSVKPTEEKFEGTIDRKYTRVEPEAAVKKLSEDGLLRIYTDVNPVAADIVQELKIQTGIIIYPEDVKSIDNMKRVAAIDGITLKGDLPFTREPARLDLSTIIPPTLDFYTLTEADLSKESKALFIETLKKAVDSDEFTLVTDDLEFSEPTAVESTLNSRVILTVPAGHRLYKAGDVNIVYKRNPWGDQAHVMGASEGDIPVYTEHTVVKGNEKAIIAQINLDYKLNLTDESADYTYDESNPARLGIQANNYQFRSQVTQWIELKTKRTPLSEIFPDETLDMFDPLEFI